MSDTVPIVIYRDGERIVVGEAEVVFTERGVEIRGTIARSEEVPELKDVI